jgi:hypothetical protein
MAVDEQQQESQQTEQGAGAGAGKGTTAKAVAAAAATGVAAVVAKKALANRGSSNGNSGNGGSGSSKSDAGSIMNTVLTSGWDAARDALLPAAEDAAGAVGGYLAENGPEIVRERIVPRFIESFNEARG